MSKDLDHLPLLLLGPLQGGGLEVQQLEYEPMPA